MLLVNVYVFGHPSRSARREPARPVHSTFTGSLERLWAFQRICLGNLPRFFASEFHVNHPTGSRTRRATSRRSPGQRVRAGDLSAYDTLVRKYERQLFRISQHITQNREDAEDVMQDAFLKAYEKLTIRCRGTRNSTHGWCESRSTRA